MQKTLTTRRAGCMIRTAVWICFSLPPVLAFGGVALHQWIDLSAHPVENCRMTVGDLNGDGTIDYLFNDGRRVLKAFDHNGNLLWEKYNPNDPGVLEQYHNFTLSINDIDRDGLNEVIGFLEIGGQHHLAVIRGSDGTVEKSVVLPFAAPRDHEFWGNTNFYMQDHVAICNLRGLAFPQDILAIHASKLKVAAYSYIDGNLVQKWYWITDHAGYSSGHYAYPYDIDGDGRDEVLAGVDILDENGNRLWKVNLPPFNPANPSWGPDHVDAMTCADIDPEKPGKEIIVVASTGMWFYQWNGNLNWWHPSKVTDPANGYFTGEGIQEVLVANLRPDIPGLEMVCYSEDMYGDNTVAVFDRNGSVLNWGTQNIGPRRWITAAMDWDGDRARDEIYSRKGIFNGNLGFVSYSMNWGKVHTVDVDEFPPVVCDVQGDQREEILWYDTNEILILKNTDPLSGGTKPSPWNEPAYRRRYANLNHCNAIYLDWQAVGQDVDVLAPNEPRNLRQAVQTETSILLDWDAPLPAADGDSAAGYQVFRNGQLVGSVPESRMEDQGLRDDTAYEYSVFAVDDAGQISLIPAIGTFSTTTFFFPTSPEGEETPLADLSASITIEKLPSKKNPWLAVLLTTSAEVVQAPGPLHLNESDGSVSAITLLGNVPGTEFHGQLLIVPNVSGGEATFSLPDNNLVDEDGNVGNAITAGRTVNIDRTPPPKPAKLYVKK